MVDSPNESEGVEFELERAYDREELAAVFREFAAALSDDRPVRIDDGDRTASVSIPSRVVAALEAEREGDEEPPVAELELELEWDDPDGSTVLIAESERETPGVVGAEAALESESGRDADEDGDGDGSPETDPATATMPPEAVPGGPESDDEPSETGAEQRGGGGRTSRFEVYEDRGGEWRWRLVHWNGNIVADSGEGYSSRSNAKRAARSVMRSAPAATVVDRED